MSNTMQALNDNNLQEINGGFPWPALITVISILHNEFPDFLSGWKDYHAGRFDPPAQLATSGSGLNAPPIAPGIPSRRSGRS